MIQNINFLNSKVPHLCNWLYCILFRFPNPGLCNLNIMALEIFLTIHPQKLWKYIPENAVKCPTLPSFKSAISRLVCSFFHLSPFSVFAHSLLMLLFSSCYLCFLLLFYLLFVWCTMDFLSFLPCLAMLVFVWPNCSKCSTFFLLLAKVFQR